MPTAIGIDIGTSSARALLVDVLTGEEIATTVCPFPSGASGVVTSPSDPYLARQVPNDYRVAVLKSLKDLVKKCKDPSDIIGIGLDATASTPLPVDSHGAPLADHQEWKHNICAAAWLWKDHTAQAEAEEITRLANEQGRPYLAKCGGAYSSEWFWSKALKCARSCPRVFEASVSWVESIDWVVAFLTGCQDSAKIARNVCAAGHKGLYAQQWGGWPDDAFLAALDPRLLTLRRSLPEYALTSDVRAGWLRDDIAKLTGLPKGVPVAVGLIDAHAGAVGSGVKPGTLVKIIGTSACDILVAPDDGQVGDIQGVSGIVKGSVLPGMLGIEAGQAAVGDLFDWYVTRLCPGRTHNELAGLAEKLAPGESGLVALDWNNGCRSVLTDQALSGLLIGQTLGTQQHEVYRSLLEATAFGARKIIERLVGSGLVINEVVACGGIAERSPLLLQIYADVLARPIKIAASEQACALGAAVFGAVVGGGHKDVTTAVGAMVRLKDKVHQPNSEAVSQYDRLYSIYSRLYDTFGEGPMMKELIAIRDEAGKGKG